MIFASFLPMLRRQPAGTVAPMDSSAALVKRATDGDRRAFDELYRAHVDSTYRLLTRLIGAGPDRDDLLQQVFLEAFRSLSRFRGESQFGTWLHRIAVNLSYHHMRKQRRTRFEEVPMDLPATGASPERAIHRDQELHRALGFLSALKPEKRIAYVLRVVEGMSLDEIAVLVGANAPAVGQRIKHAQRELSAMAERDRMRSGEESR